MTLPCGAPRQINNSLSDEYDDLMGSVMEEAMLDGFMKTQSDFASHAEKRGDLSGCTAAVALVCTGRLVLANLGDSEGLFHSNLMFGGSHTTRTKVCLVRGVDSLLFLRFDHIYDTPYILSN